MQKKSHALAFLQKFFADPKTIGAIAPTSRATADIMASFIPKNTIVLELGSGTGAITKSILKKIRKQKNLTCVEIDTDLSHILKTKYPSLRIQTEDMRNALQKNKSVDVIVSGIPFVAIKKAKRIKIFKLIKSRLKKEGVFIAFQYSLTTLKELQGIFSNVETVFSPWNIPPAFIYICRK